MLLAPGFTSVFFLLEEEYRFSVGQNYHCLGYYWHLLLQNYDNEKAERGDAISGDCVIKCGNFSAVVQT